jgi:hypothetical protein
VPIDAHNMTARSAFGTARAEGFFGVDDGPNGHVALWLGNGMIVQCSASGKGSNIRPLDGYVAPTGWVRWNLG